MTSSTTDNVPSIERLRSAVPGLDQILGGGLFRTGVYIIQGLPGCGKTILANQICYGHVAEGGSAVYVTLLAESHSRMIQHLSTLSFFDVAAFPDKLAYISAFHELETAGLKGLMAVLRREMRTRKVGVLVLDGLVAASEASPSDLDLKKFIHELQSIAVLQDCTVLLLTSGNIQRMAAEHTMVDGLIELAFEHHRRRTLRTIEVLKFRGAQHLLGRHELGITDQGVAVHPRIEDLLDGCGRPAPASERRLATGIHELDIMLHNGVLAGTTSVALGFSGSGKTTLGLHFLNTGALLQEPGVLFGFYESPDRIFQAGERIGFDLRKHVERGLFSHVWQPSYEFGLDQLGERLMREIERIGAQRVVIDSLDGFRQSATDPARTIRFMTALLGELRVREITTILTDETMKPSGPEMEMRVEGISALVENLLLFEYMTIGPKLRRLVSIVKQRASAHETTAREFFLTEHGIVIAPDARSAAEVVAHSEEFTARHNEKPRPPEGA